MKSTDGYVRAPGGRLAPLRRAHGPDGVGLALAPGVVVETDPATAVACGACFDDTDTSEEAFEAAEDPSAFWGEAGERHGSA